MKNVNLSNTIVSWFEDHTEEQKLVSYLSKHGYKFTSCHDKKQLDDTLEGAGHKPVVVIIDLNIKETDAILACNEIKSRAGLNIPFVIIVGDKAEEFTHVTALDLGADDYIVKPFKPQLFLKRIEALTWRIRLLAKSKLIQQEGFRIDSERHLILIDENSFELPKKEFELLNLFYSVPNKIFSREEIAVTLWKEEKIAKQRTIDVHIRNIRRILGKDLIKTVKGFGYGLNKLVA